MTDNMLETSSYIPDIYLDFGLISSTTGISYMINNMTLVTSDSKFLNISIGTIGGGYAITDSFQIGAVVMQNSLISLIGSLANTRYNTILNPFLFAFAVGA